MTILASCRKNVMVRRFATGKDLYTHSIWLTENQYFSTLGELKRGACEILCDDNQRKACEILDNIPPRK